MIERLRRLVQTPSPSGHEATIADLVESELRAAGLTTRRSASNVWCVVGDAPGPRLLLNSHLDTVPPGAGWEGDPFTLRRDDSRLIGLGANDAKGCVAAMIETFLRFARRVQGGEPVGGTLVLALTAEEETSGAGLETILPALSPLDAAIVGEPTGLVPMTAQRGLLMLRCVARGRTAHPANTPPATADNAIVTAAREIQRLATFDWGADHPLMGRPHANVTVIHGGTARNVIPDTCEFFVDVRTTPCESHAALTERLRSWLRCEVHVHSDRLVPVYTPDCETIVQAALGALPGTVPAASPAMSDMVHLSGTPAIKLGPGDSRRSHTPDEYILAHELVAGAAAYTRILESYFRMAACGVAPSEAGSRVEE